MGISMDVNEILRHVDHTLLSQTAVWEEIRQICDDAVAYFQILLELTYRADILSLYEMQALDQEEFRVMISNSESLHSQIYTLQNKRSNITK